MARSEVTSLGATGFALGCNRVLRLPRKALVRSAVDACVVYPRAESLGADGPLQNIVVSDYTPEDIRAELRQNSDRLTSLYTRSGGVVEDMQHVVDIVQAARETAPIQGLRFIQINRAGVGVLRIHMRGNDTFERAAFVEINEYRRLLRDASMGRYSVLLSVGCACALFLSGYVLAKLLARRT